MANTGVYIELQLIDKVTSDFSKAFNSMKKDVDKIADSMIQVGRVVTQVGRNMTFLGATITGPMAIAFKTASNYSLEANESLKRLGDSTISLQTTIGNAMVPVINKLTEGISNLTKWFENLDPKIRNAIIQTTLIAGIFFTVGGLILHVAGNMVVLIGRMMQFGLANIPLLVMSGALIALIIFWDKLKDVAMPVINAIESGLSGMGWVALQVVAIFESVFEGITRTLEKIFDLLSKIPGPQREFFETLRDTARGVADDFQTTGAAIQEMAMKLEANMINIYDGAKSNTASFIDETIPKIKSFWDAFIGPTTFANMSTFINDARGIWTQFANEVNSLGKNIANIFVDSFRMITSGFGKAVADMIVYGKNFSASMKEVFQSWAAMAIQKIIEVLTQWVIMQTIGRALEAVMIGFITVTASAVAAAWAPAAAMASLATLGSNAGPAAAALISISALSQGLAAIPKLAEGGNIESPGSILIGERGPEILNLPRGARVTPLDKTSNGNKVEVHIHGNGYFQKEQGENMEDVMMRLSVLINEKLRSRV